jgi:hypothetical protein
MSIKARKIIKYAALWPTTLGRECADHAMIGDVVFVVAERVPATTRYVVVMTEVGTMAEVNSDAIEEVS